MIGDRIKERREELGWSQEELAEKVGYSYRTAVNKIEKGNMNVTQHKIKKFADVLGVSIEWLLELDGTPPEPPKLALPSDIVGIQTKSIPIIGQISCGEPVYADHIHGEFVITGEMKADFGLYAKGDSMINARIHDGDLVLCRSQEVVENGQIAVVIIDDEATLKRFFFYPDSELVILRPENPKYREQVYHGSEIGNIRVIGRAIGVQFPI